MSAKAKKERWLRKLQTARCRECGCYVVEQGHWLGEDMLRRIGGDPGPRCADTACVSAAVVTASGELSHAGSYRPRGPNPRQFLGVRIRADLLAALRDRAGRGSLAHTVEQILTGAEAPVWTSTWA